MDTLTQVTGSEPGLGAVITAASALISAVTAWFIRQLVRKNKNKDKSKGGH